jgi:hypothetical protein
MGCGASNNHGNVTDQSHKPPPTKRQSSKITVAARNNGDNNNNGNGATSAAAAGGSGIDGEPSKATSATTQTFGSANSNGVHQSPRGDAKPLIVTTNLKRRSSRSRSPSAEKSTAVVAPLPISSPNTVVTPPTITATPGSVAASNGNGSPDSLRRRQQWVSLHGSANDPENAIVVPLPSATSAPKRPSSADPKKRLSPKQSADRAANGWESASSPETIVMPPLATNPALSSSTIINIAANQPPATMPLMPSSTPSIDRAISGTGAAPSTRRDRARRGSINIATFDFDPRFCGRRFFRRRKQVLRLC